MSFRALNLSPEILQAIDEAGYTEPTPIQVAAIPPVLAGHDVIGIAQTGTGKTAAFVWPILMKLLQSKPTVTQGHNGSRHHHSGPARGPRALVVAPTRELVVQIEENVRIYAKHMKTPQAKEQLDELRALIGRAGPVCILCYERDHKVCHRRFIAEAIHERDGVAVKNLVAPQV